MDEMRLGVRRTATAGAALFLLLAACIPSPGFAQTADATAVPGGRWMYGAQREETSGTLADICAKLGNRMRRSPEDQVAFTGKVRSQSGRAGEFNCQYSITRGDGSQRMAWGVPVVDAELRQQVQRER